MDYFPVSPGPFLPDISIDKKPHEELSLNLDIENFPEDIFSKQDKPTLTDKEDSLFDHAQGNDFSMFDNLDSFLQEFGSSVSNDMNLLPAPSPALSDSGLSTTDTGSDQMLSPSRNLEDETSGSDTSEPERTFSPMDLIKIEPQSPDSTTERVATVCTSVGERTAVPALARPVSTPTTSAPATAQSVTVLRQTRPGQSILIPVNIKGSGNIKTVKILSAPAGSSLKRAQNAPTIVGELRPTAVRHGGTTRMVYSIAGGERLQTTGGPVITVCSNRAAANGDGGAIGPDGHKRKLELSPEERRLLKKEGVILPSHYPLTREEERELKRIRRKIRNKMSAQDSRKRKKEYIDGLEDRVRACTTENQDLHKRIKRLETQNTQLSQQNNSLTKHNDTLTSQLRRLQTHITRVALGAGRGVAHPSTCLMILLLSLSLCVLPSLKEDVKEEAALAKTDASSRSARTLLSQTSKPDLLSLYLNRKPVVSGLAGFDLELSDVEEEPAPPRKRPRVAAHWLDELKQDPLDGEQRLPPSAPDPRPPSNAAAGNSTRPPASLVVTVQRQ